MSDLISRQAVKDAINEHLELATSGLGSDSIVKKIYKMANNHVIDVTSILPAIQPEQNAGRWVCLDDDELAYGCSACRSVSLRESKYCPNCGAYMKGENNDKTTSN